MFIYTIVHRFQKIKIFCKTLKKKLVNFIFMKDRLNKLRKKIDKIDRSISKLLVKRIKLAIKIGYEKKKMNLPVYDPGRENRVLKNIERVSKDKNFISGIKKIYSKIFEVSKDFEGSNNK